MRNLQPYIELIDSFVHGQMTDKVFERSYLDLFTGDDTISNDVDFDVLNDLFYEVEEYCTDPSLRDDGDMDEEQLRQKGAETLVKLKELQSKRISV